MQTDFVTWADDKPHVEHTPPDNADDLPIVYVVAYSRWRLHGQPSDYGGAALFGDAYSESFGHVSSSLDWLRNDTTVGFGGERRDRLRALYPQGFKRVVLDLTGDTPDVLPSAIEHLFTKATD
jgi:hypothetical protein